MKINHNLHLQLQSGPSNCVQTATSQFLRFYNIDVNPTELENQIPIRVDDQGRPMGTLFADIGSWMLKKHKLKVSMHVFDSQIVDSSWQSLTDDLLLAEFKKIQITGVVTARTPFATILIDAYVKYLQTGGIVKIEKCTNLLLQTLLTDGPVLAVVSYSYLYDYPRCRYDLVTKKYIVDPAGGKVFEHAIVLTGFEGDNYFYNDPDSEKGGKNTVSSDILIGAICSAQINSMNYLMSVKSNL